MKRVPLAIRLLHHAARCAAHSAAGAVPSLRLEPDDCVDVDWLLRAGLGPLLYLAIGDGHPASTQLFASDLAARVRRGALVEAAAGLIDLCQRVDARAVLLKGISVSEQHYPAGHLRPMGDIDVLIQRSAYEPLERLMLARGYARMRGFTLDQWSWHGIPLFQQQLGVWVELHTALFPENSPLRANHLFGPAQLEREMVSSSFAGRKVLRFSDEMQLVYTASGWIRDLSSQDMHPSFLPSLFDALYLLNAAGVDWDRLIGMLDNEMAAASLYILLGYLDRHQLHAVPRTVLSRLVAAQRLVGPSELAMLHRLLDRYLVSGRRSIRLLQTWHIVANLVRPGTAIGKLLHLPWNVLFPPDKPERYRAGYQIGRVSRRLRALTRRKGKGKASTTRD
jgi:hypothetical protein